MAALKRNLGGQTVADEMGRCASVRPSQPSNPARKKFKNGWARWVLKHCPAKCLILMARGWHIALDRKLERENPLPFDFHFPPASSTATVGHTAASSQSGSSEAVHHHPHPHQTLGSPVLRTRISLRYSLPKKKGSGVIFRGEGGRKQAIFSRITHPLQHSLCPDYKLSTPMEHLLL
ncbi:hypothetical protein PGT21_006479 [Puccinia graminis f. sp. tritici]|uniref:Uncharacterized protein n=1 Tax=Puccinia graminis f. sp. tritici TaxID=56615 RepID=A0A5B0PKN6_PUCGR|nr:hypothetical protein PGT21_006479 [Puccinia graminis f. sp. tritici]